MADRNPKPTPDLIVERLRTDPDDPEQDYITLLGFIGEGPAGHVRIHPRPDLQAFMDIPDADVVDSLAVDHSRDALVRTVVWVRRESMYQSLFKETVLATLEGELVDVQMSVWSLIPETRYVAAELLGLVHRWPAASSERD